MEWNGWNERGMEWNGMKWKWTWNGMELELELEWNGTE